MTEHYAFAATPWARSVCAARCRWVMSC